MRQATFRTHTQEGSSTQYLRVLVAKTIKGMVLGTRNLKCLVLGPSGIAELDFFCQNLKADRLDTQEHLTEWPNTSKKSAKGNDLTNCFGLLYIPMYVYIHTYVYIYMYICTQRNNATYFFNPGLSRMALDGHGRKRPRDSSLGNCLYLVVALHHTADRRNPASHNTYYTKRNPMASVHKVIQDLDHQQ